VDYQSILSQSPIQNPPSKIQNLRTYRSINSTMKIAIAQLNPTIGDLQGNAKAILAAAQAAARSGSSLLLTPELSLCGYPPRDLLMNPSFVDEMAVMLADLAQDLPNGLAVLVGTVTPNPNAAKQGGKRLYNSMALLIDGSCQALFHKRLLPTYDVFDEDRYFEPGQAANHFTLEGVKIGVTICEDLWNDEEFWGQRNYADNPIGDLSALGVDLIVNLSASPYTVGKQQVRERLLSHMAKRFDHPIIYVNQVGGNDDLIFDGGSCAVNRSGAVVLRGQSFATNLCYLEAAAAGAAPPMSQLIATTGEALPFPIDDRVIGTPSPTVASDLDSNAEIFAALTLGVGDYVRKCGFSKVVLGLSGGIDSALVAAVAAAALGPENVLGVLMPSPYSSDHSISDALSLAQNLGIPTQTIPIGPLMSGFDQSLETLFGGTEFGVAEENLQSRIRGNLVMAIANKFGYLLLSTGNKSEISVGYCTLYGDMNGGLAVIADLPKLRVYQLCEWLNRHSIVIPPDILTKPPSAELKPGQTDQDSLPPYEVLDDILARLVERHQSAADIVAAGHLAATVERVVKLVKMAEFKRKQAAPGLKVTDRAFGTGWRMPIAQCWVSRL
jgi:NAD+ synthase (glutamine-hydrolysing)